jgi:tetratricopeptide (TPR) repeat protein
MIGSWRIASAAFVMLASAWALAGEPAASQPARPVLHLLAPSHDYAANYDCLVPEAALRSAAIDLAARAGQYARFWPVDQLDQVPSDAYPRVQVSWEKMPPMPYAKMARRGDLFTFLASTDVKQYVTTGQVHVQMPARTFVGFFAVFDPKGREIRVSVSDLRLNGRPLAKPERRSIGKPTKPAEAALGKETWTLTTYGGDYETGKDEQLAWREHGEFAYVAAEGDFELAGRLGDYDRANDFAASILMCRAGFEYDSAMASVSMDRNGTIGGSRALPYKFPHNHVFHEAHLLCADLLTAEGHSKRIASVPVSYVNWDALAGCTQQFANQIRQGLAKQLQLPIADEPKPSAASPDALERLDAARKTVLQVTARDVLAGSREIDALLGEAPLCPSVHYTASLCGTVLALGDPYGRFHEAGRCLAGPLSFWLYARQLAAPQRSADHLATAWLALAAGYPNSALAIVRDLPEPDQSSPEAKGLVMFATRDYRALPKHQVSEATRIEQLAWVFACKHCGRNDLLEEEGPWLARNARSPVYAMDLRSENFGAPALAITLGYCRSVADLLGDERIPPAPRRQIADRLADVLEMPVSDDLRNLASAMASGIYKMGPMFMANPERISSRIAVLLDLYAAAQVAPCGPVSAALGLGWQCLPPHDVAEQQRGLFLMTLMGHARMLGTQLGVPDECHRFCQAAGKGVAAMPGAGPLFEAYGLLFVGKGKDAQPLLAKAMQTPLGRHAETVAAILLTYGQAVPDRGKGKHRLWPGRGAWEWADLCKAAMGDGSGQASDSIAWRCIEADAHAYAPMEVLYWQTQSLAAADRFLERIPYHVGLLSTVANYAIRQGQNGRYVELSRRIIDLAPESVNGYSKLAYYHSGRNELAEAIEIAREAAENCEESIGLTNLIGNGACWLVKENQPEEALKWGRMSATSYSYTGLKGLAVALAANDQKEESEKVWRQIAFRYESGADEYMQLLLEHARPEKVILDELQALMDNYPSTQTRVAYDASRGFCTSGADPALLEKAYAGPLSFVPPAQQKMRLLTCAMYAQRFDKAVEHGLAAEAIQPLPVYERVWLHAAMRMSGRKERIKEIENNLRQAGKIDITPHIQYLLGGMDWTQLRRHSQEGYAKAYAFWLRGIEREIAGDLTGAVDDYRVAASVRNNGDASWLSYCWRKALVKQYPATTQAAAATQDVGESPFAPPGEHD